MSNKSETIIMNAEALVVLQELQKKQNAGEIINPHAAEALRAIGIASKVVNAIMSGNQIDPVFFKKLSDITLKRIQNLDNSGNKKVIKKTKKFKKSN